MSSTVERRRLGSEQPSNGTALAYHGDDILVGESSVPPVRKKDGVSGHLNISQRSTTHQHKFECKIDIAGGPRRSSPQLTDHMTRSISVKYHKFIP